MFALARKFVRTVLPGVIKPLRVLWNEIIAFLFFALFLVAAMAAWRSWRNFKGDSEDIVRLAAALIFGLVMLGYALHSFSRARKIGRS